MQSRERTIGPVESEMVEFVRALDAAGSLEVALDAVTLAAVDLVPGAEVAGVTLRRPRERLWSVATTSSVAEDADRLQYDLDQGPCVDAARTETLVSSADVGSDARWPLWGPAAARSIGSVLSVQLLSARGVHGALNVYSSRTDAFSSESVYAAVALSVHAGVAMRTVLLEEDMQRALASKVVIGQAQGILMHRFGLAPDAAFAVLSRYSQHHNTKVIDLARSLVWSRGAVWPPAAGCAEARNLAE